MAGLLRIPDAARLLGVSRSKLYLLMDCGELAFVKFGKARRISPAELELFVERHTERSQPKEEDHDGSGKEAVA
ncbi:MAG: helix-turn-helix domain-containing protein [Planctomycetia bacterium]|nr:helix-turn-helix domain-containing protein [Planctomycetia bacterium]